MEPLDAMEPPKTKKALQRALGMFSYYSKWIPNFSDEAYDLFKAEKFPLKENEVAAFY